MGRFLFLALLAASQKATTLPYSYVIATNGNDSWSCTLSVPKPSVSPTDGPCLTIAHVHALVRAGGRNARQVFVRAGTYILAADLAFTFSDDDSSWAAYPGDPQPVLDGSSGTYKISFTGVKNVSFSGFKLQNMAPANFIKFNGGTAITISNNLFSNCGTSCIQGGTSNRGAFINNTFNGSTRDSSMLILGFGSSYNIVSHNLFENAEGGGVQIQSGSTDPPTNHNVIDRNVFFNLNLASTDNGAIYEVDRHHQSIGNVISNNIVNGNGHSATDATNCIYLDDLMSHVLVTGNVCTNIKGQYAFQIHGGDHNTFVNNIFDLSKGAQLGFYQVSSLADGGMAQNTFQQNIVYSASTFTTSLWKVSVNKGTDSLPINRNNLYYSANSSPIPNTDVPDSAPVYNRNPLFRNSSEANYSMPAASPAYSIQDFVALPTDQGPMPIENISPRDTRR